MNETEDKNLFRKNLMKPYAELKDDGKKYYAVEELQLINDILQCDSKNGVIIAGPKGCGKTALMRNFIQQDLNKLLGVESMKVVYIKPIWTIVNLDVDKMLEIISNLINEYNSASLILYAEFESLEMINKALNVMDLYLDEIKEYYDIKFLKIIFELSVASPNDLEILQKKLKNSYIIVDCVQKRDIDLLIDMMVPRVDELSKKYEVSYTRDMLLFFIAIESGWTENCYNINSYLNVIEYAFLLSKKSEKTKLEKDIAKLIYPDSFKYLDETSEEALKNTAIHEAGHTLIRLINSSLSDIRYVSIIPGRSNNGVTSFEGSKRIASYYKNQNLLIKEVSECLAGRIAEQKLNPNVKSNTGASSDLKAAMQKINDMITRYGFSESIGKNYVILDDEKYISEKTKMQLEDEKREILKKSEKYAENQIFEHQEFVKSLSEELFKELVLSKHKVYDMWEKYLQSKKNEE